LLLDKHFQRPPRSDNRSLESLREERDQIRIWIGLLGDTTAPDEPGAAALGRQLDILAWRIAATDRNSRDDTQE
jgi:uncharacterized protein involved in exopolysaccharide biosynthesis